MSKSFYGSLFDHGKSKDVCANKHGGNEQSVNAFNSIRDSLTEKQEACLAYIESRVDYGATAQEYADYLGVSINVISGRFSELAKAELIKKIGTRNRGGVFVKK